VKVAFLWPYYPGYLRQFQDQHPEVSEMGYGEHRQSLFADHYAWPAALGRYMQEQGLEVEFIVGNDECLQKKWAAAHGFRWPDADWERAIAFEQIRRFRPDVLWIGFTTAYSGDFVRSLRPSVGRIAIWMGSPVHDEVDTDGISVLLTENPRTLQHQQHQFERVVVTRPCFDRQILESLKFGDRPYDVSFIGQITPIHLRRLNMLAHLLDNGIRVRIHALFTGELMASRKELFKSLLNPGKSGCLRRRRFMSTSMRFLRPVAHNRRVLSVRAATMPPVFGMEMYWELARSVLTLNVHFDGANANAGNMRLFEATGAGACLVTDRASNLDTMFETGREVLVYGSKHELLQVIRDALSNRKRTEKIARAGQLRTLRDHTEESMFHRVWPALSGQR